MTNAEKLALLRVRIAMGLIAEGHRRAGKSDASELVRFNTYAIPRWADGDEFGKDTVIGWFTAYGVEQPDWDQPL